MDEKCNNIYSLEKVNDGNLIKTLRRIFNLMKL
jgi:hypothetical protein